MKTIKLTPAQLDITFEALLYYQSVLEDNESVGWKEGRKLRSLHLVLKKL